MSRDYLIIEPFLADALQSRALEAAFDLGIIDALTDCESLSVNELLDHRDCDQPGGTFLLQMLTATNVVTQPTDCVALTEAFRAALQFRDLLTTRLRFAGMVASDYFTQMPQLLRSQAEFMAASKLFEMFDYGRCLDVTTANCMHASRWMQLTTMLSRYEAPVCHEHYNFSRHQRLLDVGGNSGEFALQICHRQPHLQATVLDLPVVCHVGQRHLHSTAPVNRIRFQPGNMLQDEIPCCDLITYKSVLHDWPDDEMRHMLKRSHQALPAGGTLLIFERQQWDFSRETIPYGLLPVMLFFRSYRSPDTYMECLRDVGFVDIETKGIQLEVPFLLITARKS